MADTMTEMIFGFAVILGVLGVYIVLLAVRLRRARIKNARLSEDKTES